MSRDALTVTGVVEQMLDHAAHGRRDALEPRRTFHDRHPESLPYATRDAGTGDRPEMRTFGKDQGSAGGCAPLAKTMDATIGLVCAGVGQPVGVPALPLAWIIGYAANTLPVPAGSACRMEARRRAGALRHQ